ncbi:VOC family protein [Virgibacillus flavescens]|uniref:VOC family protein n=1 Tax=Virgibacillus flavescens TaxID=1611422 RepID=UPI003D3371F5
MLALDHIVVAAKDAEELSADYGNEFTIKSIKGGQHTEWGTHNYLSYFSNDSYIEWLGTFDDEKASNATNPLAKHLMYVLNNNITGPFQFALRTNQMDKYMEHFKQNDISFDGPISAEREKPDGSVLKWRMLFPKYNFETEVLPFLIEWEDPKNAYPDTSLLNTQTIKQINFGGIGKEAFAKIYQLKPKKLNKNQFPLQNSKIRFTDNHKLEFDLI